MKQYLVPDELERKLASIEDTAHTRVAEAKAYAAEDAEGFMDVALELAEAAATMLTVGELRAWIAGHTVTGDLILPTLGWTQGCGRKRFDKSGKVESDHDC